jgi:hypothetical protein
MFESEDRDAIPVEIPDALYLELFDCEVDPFDGNFTLASHHQFAQSLLNAEQNGNIWEADFTEDALVYLLNISLPYHMEMWYTWGDDQGELLLEHAKDILDEFNTYYPY